MLDASEISADLIRQNLLERAEAFSARSGWKLSRIGEEAIRDSKFLPKVRDGANFTVATYQRVLDWLDEQERAA